MKRRTFGAACLIGIALAGGVQAQGTGEAVLLRYHFQPGQEFRYRLTLTGDMGMSFAGVTPPPGANMPGRIPMTMTGTYEFHQKVKAVTPDGVATISAGIDKMDLSTGVMGTNIVARLGADGKMETLMNGQPITVPNTRGVNFSNPIYEGTIDPTGKIAGVNPDSLKSMNQLFGGQNIASMFNGMPGMGGLILPSQPIKPGDTWDNKYDFRMPIPTPGMPGAAPGGLPAGASLSMSFVLHNKLLRVEEGRAIIETQMTATIPPGTKMTLPTPAGAGMPAGARMSIDKMAESMTGTQRFQIERGAVEGSDFSATITSLMAIGLPPGMMRASQAQPALQKGAAHPKGHGAKPGSAAHRPGTAAAPRSAAPTTLKIGMDGTMKLRVESLNAAAAAPAAPAAPPAAP